VRSFFSDQVIDYGHFLFRYRNFLFPLILCFLFLVFPPYPLEGNPELDVLMDIFGMSVIFSGQIIRAAVIGLAYIKRGGVNKKIHAEKLVKNGIFTHCRNPLYVGNLTIITGFLIIHNNLWVYLIGGTFFLFSYQAIVKAEEAFLLNRFGEEFKEYCNHVNRWIINISGIDKTLGSMKFNWQRVVVKDYTTMLTWMLTVILLIIVEHINLHGFEFSRLFIVHMALPVTLILSAFLLIRIMKKNGTLSA